MILILFLGNLMSETLEYYTLNKIILVFSRLNSKSIFSPHAFQINVQDISKQNAQ